MNIPDGFDLVIIILQDDIDVTRDSITLTDSENNWNFTRDVQRSMILPNKLITNGVSPVFVSVYVDPILPGKSFEFALTLVENTGRTGVRNHNREFPCFQAEPTTTAFVT